MDKAHEKANETRKRNQEARAERHRKALEEKAAQLIALRKIRDSDESTVEQRLKAVELIEKLS